MSATQGHVKRDPATGAVAVRTHFDESIPQLAEMAWLVADPTLGPRHTTTATVNTWHDLHTPPEPEPGE